MSDDHKRGEDILKLLGKFSLKPLIGEVQPLYDNAYHHRELNPEKAIGDCNTALDILKNPSPRTLPDKEELADAEGRFYLMLASIYLNQEAELDKAKEYYEQSRDSYRKKTWRHFESLAWLGLAITLRKLKSLQEASNACEWANDIISGKIDDENLSKAIDSLRKAIEQERRKIQNLLHSEDQPPPPDKPIPIPGGPKKSLRVIEIVEGKNIIEEKLASTDFYPLVFSDYKDCPIIEILEIRTGYLRKADYVLKVSGINEIRGRINEVGEQLEVDHLIFIKTEGNRKNLNGKRVAVLVLTRTDTGIRTCATLKIFKNGKDHCLLKGIHPEDSSIAVASYDTKSEMGQYYSEYEPSARKFAYDVAVSGEVIDVVHSNELA